MPKRDISSFFNSLPKRQKADSDDHVALEAAKSGPKAASKSHQKRLTPSKKRRTDTASIDLTELPGGSTRFTAQNAVAVRKQQFINILGDGGDSQAAALKKVQERFAWLDEKNARDIEDRSSRHPEYDDRTVRVPPEVLKKMSGESICPKGLPQESQKQYWQVKSRYRDTIIFFKVGKFYELYEDDAQIGVDVLGWRQTIAGVGHCRQVGCPESGIDDAVQRLASLGYKVARMEQMETAAEAKAKRGPKATIRRQLTRVHTPATSLSQDISVDAVHLMALAEAPSAGASGALQEHRTRLSFAFLDAAAGFYYVGSAEDDVGRSTLGALLAQVAPRELLVPRGMLSPASQRLLKTPATPISIVPVTPGTEFPDPSALASPDTYQKQLCGLLVPHEVQVQGAASLAALSALCMYLKRCHADKELATSTHKVMPYSAYAGALCLDGPTLTNLELLESSTGSSEGSLLSCLDSCASAGGRRLVRQWICRPLRDVAAINGRLDAVQELIERPELVVPLRSALQGMPDLERALGRLRSAAVPPPPGLPLDHLKSAQNRRLATLDEGVTAVAQGLSALRQLAQPEDGSPPAASAVLAEATRAIPEEGSAAVQTLMDIDDSIVKAQPAAPAAKGAKGRKKASATASLHPDILAQQAHEDGKGEDEDQLQKEIEITSILILRFMEHGDSWDRLQEALSTVDVLTAFGAFTETVVGNTCRPHILPATSQGGHGPVLELKGLWNPCAVPPDGGCIVPNDLKLGSRAGNAPHTMLLTGPNMGGKSTLLRAACCAVILAQTGCPVPAESAVISITDRIFTRLGAQDRILAGESTFLVECTEAATILQHATADSLVILDELGRGTSTFDGYAIAYAVLRHLSSAVDCRTLFATHFHPLASTEFRDCPRVALGHMAALVKEAHGADAGSIAFLYELQGGACPKSYGLQVAQLAGLQPEITKRAQQAGVLLERKLQGAFSQRGAKALTTEQLQRLKNCAAAISMGQPWQAWQQEQHRKLSAQAV